MCRNSLLGSGTRRVSQSHGAYVPVVEGRGQKKRVNKHIIYSQRVMAPGRKIGKIKGMGCGVVRECF